MASVNKVILIGNLGKDPEIRTTPQGTTLARFSLATTTAWKDASGAKQERTEWHDIVAWEKLAQICGEYLQKGKQVYVEGSLQTRSWEDQNGQKRYKTEVKASNVVMLGRREDGARSSSAKSPRRPSRRPPERATTTTCRSSAGRQSSRARGRPNVARSRERGELGKFRSDRRERHRGCAATALQLLEMAVVGVEP